MDEKIDFVITWVDDSDSKWREEFEYYSAKEGRYKNTKACRYRDWGTLRYWFRGVEKFAPWVNKIYFVTYGHLPQWLNTDNPKLVIVKHEDFIPHEYLPTFNSFTIEFHLHKLKGLSERFVHFCDDMFIIDYVSPDRFFRNGIPCDKAVLSVLNNHRGMYGSSVFLANDLINTYFNKKSAIRNNLFKWYNPLTPRIALHNFIFHRYSLFPGFYSHHLPQGFLKKTYYDVWDKCEKDIVRTCQNRFRSYGDICRWLIRFWQLASGDFVPYNVNKDGKVFYLSDKSIADSVECIRHQKKIVICLNDGEHVTHFEDNKEKLLKAFMQILPEKSSFEL